MEMSKRLSWKGEMTMGTLVFAVFFGVLVGAIGTFLDSLTGLLLIGSSLVVIIYLTGILRVVHRMTKPVNAEKPKSDFGRM